MSGRVPQPIVNSDAAGRGGDGIFHQMGGNENAPLFTHARSCAAEQIQPLVVIHLDAGLL
jgi:hypothetical protein